MYPHINDRNNLALYNVTEVFSDEEFQDLCQRISASGVLGRSKNYSALLKYLAQSSLSGEFPKEIELAVDVLGRAESFDVSVDSTVRVYVHHLRKKLDNYYSKYEPSAVYRIVIPKGQYKIAVRKMPSNVFIEKSIWEQGFPPNLYLSLIHI